MTHLTIDDINGYVDQKNALMLAVLGLHETLYLFNSKSDNNYWIEYNILGEAQFCFEDDIQLYKWSIIRMLENDIVLNILGWGNDVIDYVE